MNIQTGTIEELAELLKVCDDDSDHHIVWVAFNGEVNVVEESDFESNNTRNELDDPIKALGYSIFA